MAGSPLFTFDSVAVKGPAGVRLDDIGFEIPDTGITTLLGPSGAGKSTLLRLCNRLEVPSSGKIYYRGRDLVRFDPLELRRQVGMVFQSPVLFGGTVRDNLAQADGDAGERRFEEALERAALDGSFLDRPGTELSGGEAQRVCLARALVANPDALLMDEPTSSLDGGAVARLERLGRDLADGGVPIVWVTHDLAQMERISDRVAILLSGTLRFFGGELPASGDDELMDFLRSAHAD